MSGLGRELLQIGFDVPQPARKNRPSRAGRNSTVLREGTMMVGMGRLLCFLGPTPGLLKSFGILPLAATLTPFHTQLCYPPARDLLVASTVLPPTRIVFDDRQQRAIQHVH